MKCQYCGSNLGIYDINCPYCGRENIFAAEYVADKQSYEDELKETKVKSQKKARLSERAARGIVIAVLSTTILIMLGLIKYYDDFDARLERKEQKRIEKVTGNVDAMDSTLAEMERNREYLAMFHFVLNYELEREERYRDYARVFSAVTNYQVIYSDILNIIDGYTGYDQKTKKDWCADIAIYISNWNNYVEGEFWHDSEDSPMHTGEHGAFLAEAKRDTQDMVQVYFKLTDEQANNMWTMGESKVAEMLYNQCKVMYPEEGTNE